MGRVSIMGRLILAVVLSVTVIPMASAQGDISFLHSVGSYKERTAQYQIGYTTGLVDMLHWMIGEEPGIKDKIDTCLAGKGDADISIMFDGVTATGEMNSVPGAIAFVDMLDGTCGTDVSNSVVLVAGDINEDSMSLFLSVTSYRGTDPLYQTGYTSGMMDLFHWIVAKSPQVRQQIDQCIGDNSAAEISILFDTVIAAGDFDAFASAPVFVTLMNTTCRTQVAARVDVEVIDVGRREAGDGAEGCTPVAALPKGLLLMLARTGQLTELYELGALC